MAPGSRLTVEEASVSENPDQIATGYIDRWQKLWNEQRAVSALYTDDSVLVGFRTAVGKADIAALLQSIREQGWTGIAIKVVNARAVAGVVVVACEYTAIGSGRNAGQTRDGKSSHVLALIGDTWLSAMHTTT
jgi:ketosteroid isomerase-like protein